jgi:hypothetical protein
VLAETVGFETVDYRDREAVIDLGDVDILLRLSAMVNVWTSPKPWCFTE